MWSSRASDDLSIDKCTALFCESSYKGSSPGNLNVNKQLVTKQKLCRLVCAFPHSINHFANPNLQIAVYRLNRVKLDLLPEETHRKVQLQGACYSEVISRWKLVHESGFSGRRCTTRLLPRRIRSVYCSRTTESKCCSKKASGKDDRSKNVMIVME